MADRGDQPARLSGPAGRNAFDRNHGDGGQSPRRRHLRPDQSAHTAYPMTAIETRVAPPGPLREFWHYFSENSGAVAGLIIIVAVAILAILAPVVAPHSPILTNSAAFL